MAKDEKSKRTRLIEAGRRKEWRGRLVNPPVERASTILFDSVAELEASRPGLGTYRYGLQGTATQWALAEALTDLEPGAAGTALYCSGLAAITAPLLAVLGPGDELLLPDNVYGPTRKFCETFLKRYGVSSRYYDPLIGTGIAELISNATRAILLESPGSVTMEVQDVPGICAVARERGIVTLLDNTWATPLLFEAIPVGVDISILAGTKYVGGHADVMLGSATANAAHYEHLQQVSWDLGYSLSPDDAWLGSRGLRTMAVRLKRDFKGASGLFSFELKGADRDQRNAFVDRLELFGIGYSWGGFESLALPIDPYRTVTEPPAPNLVRLHIGLENSQDLIDDLKSSLKSVSR
jgi:cystathionine beta-lyase